LFQKVKVDDPKDTLDALSPERLASLDIFVSKFQERGEQITDQQKVEEKDSNEGYQSHKEEQEFTHASTDDNDPESDRGGFQVQKRLKNEGSRNYTKPIPLRPARRVDSDHIFTFSNRLRMRKLSHSDRFPKQLKSQ
jgi:hypothetical protein